MRHTRSAMIEALNTDYVRTALAKGMPRRRIILKHALRNALVPVVTLGALEFGQLLGGSVLTEYVFSVPGIGKLLVDWSTTATTPWCRRWCFAPARSTSPSTSSPTSPIPSSTPASGVEPAHERTRREHCRP